MFVGELAIRISVLHVEAMMMWFTIQNHRNILAGTVVANGAKLMTVFHAKVTETICL